MALVPITQPVRETRTAGQTSGQNRGAIAGAGLGAALGVAAAPATGGASLALGALSGAATGASLGGLVGQQVQPGQAPQVTQEMLNSVPTVRLSQGSQQLLDGIRALDKFPALAQKYMQPLTEAYIQSQAQLKLRS